jgi:hypothetical protein
VRHVASQPSRRIHTWCRRRGRRSLCHVTKWEYGPRPFVVFESPRPVAWGKVAVGLALEGQLRAREITRFSSEIRARKDGRGSCGTRPS